MPRRHPYLSSIPGSTSMNNELDKDVLVLEEPAFVLQPKSYARSIIHDVERK